MIEKRTARPYRSSALPLVGLILLITATASARPGEKPERTRARELGYAGVEAYAVQDFATASVKLEEAYWLLPMPTLGLWSARALVKLGKWVEAEQRYRAVVELVVGASDSEVQRRAQEEAAREREELLSKLPAVLLELSDARSSEVKASIDGVSFDSSQFGRERRVNPGRHVVTGQRGAETVELVFELESGERKQLWLRFAPPGGNAALAPSVSDEPRPDDQQIAAPYPPLRTAGWVAVAAGGAGLLTSFAAYLIGNEKYSELKSGAPCVNEDCAEDIDAYNSLRAVHLGALIGGTVLGVAGVGLLIATPADAKPAGSKTTLTLRFDSKLLTLGGSF